MSPDGLETDMILGDVLLTRHPCKLPTDVVKWRCVDKPRLRNRTDVIILSVKGLHRAAEILAGGELYAFLLKGYLLIAISKVIMMVTKESSSFNRSL